MIIKTRIYRLNPNQKMRKALDSLCDYRRYSWNIGLETWQNMHEARQLSLTSHLKAELKKPKKKQKLTDAEREILANNPAPSWRRIRDELTENKQYWQTKYPAHVFNLALQDLGNAWQNFFDKAQPDWGKPKFKSKKAPRQSFKMDQAKIKDGYLFLEKPRAVKEKWNGFKLNSGPLSNDFGTISFYKEKDKYYASIPFKIADPEKKSKTGKYTGVDVNVGHFNYKNGQCMTMPKSLIPVYRKIKYYQKQLAKKRAVNGRIKGMQSKNYLKTRNKLQAAYDRAKNIQNDLMQKFTTKLVNEYDSIVIEDLDVKKMMMSHIASKGMHRSMFGLFRQILTYKCDWYGKKLIIANKLYPSTQRCAACGLVKKGDERITLKGNKKHSTKHNEFVCYNPNCPNYNKKVDRDENAMLNLTMLVKHPELNKAI